MIRYKIVVAIIHFVFILPGVTFCFTYSLLKKSGLDILEKAPVIKIELDPPIVGASPIIALKNLLEIKLKFRINETLEHAFKLFPEKKEVYMIFGNTGTEQYFAALCRMSSMNHEKRVFFTSSV